MVYSISRIETLDGTWRASSRMQWVVVAAAITAYSSAGKVAMTPRSWPICHRQKSDQTPRGESPPSVLQQHVAHCVLFSHCPALCQLMFWLGAILYALMAYAPCKGCALQWTACEWAGHHCIIEGYPWRATVFCVNSCEHELELARVLGMLGNLDANTGDAQTGWDTDQFMTGKWNWEEILKCMAIVCNNLLAG